jgi:hypothetical protein
MTPQSLPCPTCGAPTRNLLTACRRTDACVAADIAAEKALDQRTEES